MKAQKIQATPQRPLSAVDTLCQKCGLCCNGVLFADVELTRSDKVSQLSALGLATFRKRGTPAFHQPCSCFDGKLCRIYSDRPAQCRAFECRLLKRVQRNEMAVSQALQVIREALRQVQEVAHLCRELRHPDEHMSLTARYSAIMREPIDLAEESARQKRRSKLAMAMARLMAHLERHFR